MKGVIAILIGIAALTSATAAQVPHPAAPTIGQAAADTPAVAQAKRLLQAAITSDETGFRRLTREIYPAADFSTAEWIEMRSHLARLNYHGVASATATHAELSVFNPDMDHWMQAVVDVDPAEPHTITSFGLHMSPRPANVPGPPKLQPAQLAAAARSMSEGEAAAGRFAGAVLIARNGQPLLSAAYGLADEASRKPNTVATQFRFGSIGKLFTSVAIMQLAEAGKLDLTAPVGRYLKSYPNAEIAGKVTIDELLTHSGGTGDIFGAEFDAHRASLRSPKDYVALYGARPPLFPPGARQEYSNYGFILLGRIVEVVSGLTFDDYLHKNIFAPARMISTEMEPENVAIPSRATAYTRANERLQPVTAEGLRSRASGYMEYRGGPAGGGYSTVGDFERFGEALLSNRLLSAAYTRKLTAGRVALPNGAMAHYDFGGPTEDGRRFIGHGGGASGQSAEFRIYPGGYVVVVLANRDPPIATRMMTFIADRLP